MAARFAELAWSRTPMGELSLRRRREPVLDVDVYEVKLGEEYLMSSLFTVAEQELARLGLAPLSSGPGPVERAGPVEPAERAGLDVVVGGLGLGYTAVTALQDPRVRSLVVVEALAEVIGWHRDRLLPVSPVLVDDPRTRLVHGDFFALARGAGPDPEEPGRRFDAILLDVDHTPTHVLHPSHADLYTRDGLTRLRGHLLPGGTFALWSDDPPDDAFRADLAAVFDDTDAHVVTFANPLTRGESTNTVYVARAGGPLS